MRGTSPTSGYSVGRVWIKWSSLSRDHAGTTAITLDTAPLVTSTTLLAAAVDAGLDVYRERASAAHPAFSSTFPSAGNGSHTAALTRDVASRRTRRQ